VQSPRWSKPLSTYVMGWPSGPTGRLGAALRLTTRPMGLLPPLLLPLLAAVRVVLPAAAVPAPTGLLLLLLLRAAEPPPVRLVLP
jgi:hypothetical protein